MSCRRYQSQLMAYVYDGASLHGKAAAHLETCADCQRFVRAATVGRMSLAAAGPASPPGDLAQRAVVAAFDDTKAAPARDAIARLIAMARPATAAAVALAVVLFLVFVVGSGKQPSVAMDHAVELVVYTEFVDFGPGI